MELKDSMLGFNPIEEVEDHFFDSEITRILSKAKPDNKIIFNLTFEVSNKGHKYERKIKNLNEAFSWIGGLLAVLTPLVSFVI